ncbi:hypothetical protein [Brevundimonas sp. SL130]|uniref:hypothetical protein n=1 Tax=Brevundimonas sp. SL130 TaxID=2995143 RepID=UPI00226CA9BA|nr:hypothetical protein [Brevundimonas sp. SL130]WAC60238.1 hypothetical protein OU998_01975 [Brevundimonas sp. SL130]
MSAKPKLFDPYARMDGPMVSQQLIDDLRGPSPSAEAMAWVARSLEDAEAAPARAATEVLADLDRLIDGVEAERGR